MPLDEPKVGCSFVTHMLGFERKQAVLQAMIDVGHGLSLSGTIEGIDVVQGLFFSRPQRGEPSARALSFCALRQAPDG